MLQSRTMQRIFNAWGLLPAKARLGIQVFAVGLLSYLVKDLSDGDLDDWENVKQAALIALSYAGAALLTPLSPYVGVGKPDVVSVPDEPPIVDEDSV